MNVNKNNENVLENIAISTPWAPVKIEDTDSIPKGDMPGDKIKIGPEHIKKAQLIFPELLDILIPALNRHPNKRAVIAVCGGSGVGKSEIASLISYYLNCLNVGSYTLSGDNYPNRIPKYNDAERLRIYRQSGIKGLIFNGQYIDGRHQIIRQLQDSGNDSEPEYVKTYPWLSIYQNAGRNGLKNYLGTGNEIDFNELSAIISQFKNGEDYIYLKRMGREETELWYEKTDFTDKKVLVIEWTHGNSHNIQGVDIPILLNSTPQETLEHRRSRNRDGAVDSSFTTMVLGIEQEMLISQASKAKLILSKNGDLLSYHDFIRIMAQEQF
ncbi:adenylylsulfate kinase [Anaerocolumna jejuensis]|uniref:adenylylsulfate kinase n=1 Tax=Anaerocolumna jejuensis TaxID=259063 RepID=UPI003F7B7E24